MWNTAHGHCRDAPGDERQGKIRVGVEAPWHSTLHPAYLIERPDPNYLTGAHTKHRLQYHLVWIPKYRKRVLLGEVAIRLKQLVYKAAQVNRWRIREVSIQRDHVHLLIQIGPTVSVARVVQRLKDGTSFILRKEFPDLEEFLWGESFWADGYFAESVGMAHEDVIRTYIREQQKDQSMPET